MWGKGSTWTRLPRELIRRRYSHGLGTGSTAHYLQISLRSKTVVACLVALLPCCDLTGSLPWHRQPDFNRLSPDYMIEASLFLGIIFLSEFLKNKLFFDINIIIKTYIEKHFLMFNYVMKNK
jgi:hypothetical protein